MNQEIKDKLINYFLEKKEELNDISFKKYLGYWSKSEYLKFNDRIKDFESVNLSEWDS